MYLLLQNLDKTLIKTSVFKNPLLWSLSWLPLPWDQPGMLGVGALGQVWVCAGSRDCPLSPAGLGWAQPGLAGTEGGALLWGLQHPLGQCCPLGEPGTAWEGSPSCLWGGTALEEQGTHLCQLGMGAELCPLPLFGTSGSLPLGCSVAPWL